MGVTEDIKKQARMLGADAVGIASMDRFEGAPPQMDPRFIMPRAKSLIAMAFRVMRGSMRGIEEGTFFSNYSAMGYGGLTYLYIPMTVINLCKTIEDEGYEAVPIGHQSDWRAIDNTGNLRENYSRPVEPGKPAPDIMIHLRLAAFAAGLGEIGFSKMLLTPEFGPRQRIGVVLTELELDPSPLYDGPVLCDRCLACVSACPGKCFDPGKTVKVNVAGRELEWMDLDMDACGLAFRGGKKIAEGEKGSYFEEREDIKPSEFSPFYKKPENLYNTGQAICGSRGCTRACMINLEKRGVLKNQFKSEFRTRKPWKVDWSDVEGPVPFGADGQRPEAD